MWSGVPVKGWRVPKVPYLVVANDFSADDAFARFDPSCAFGERHELVLSFVQNIGPWEQVQSFRRSSFNRRPSFPFASINQPGYGSTNETRGLFRGVDDGVASGRG
jgi:hypothetical protein